MPPSGASTLPPFIPGLLIVSLLIIISILIGWRNYARRETTYLPGPAEWGFWQAEDTESSAPSGPEKPKLWEVSVDNCGRKISEKSPYEIGWEHLMPLAATSLTPEPPPATTPQISETSQNHTFFRLPSYFSRFNFLSHTATSPISPSPTISPIPLHRLQLSVIISMPTLSTQTTPTPLRLRHMSITSSSPSSDGDISPRASMSSNPPQNLLGDLSVDGNKMKGVEGDGVPNVVFGTTILPWRKDDDDPEAARTT